MDRASLSPFLLRLIWPFHTDILQTDKVLLWQRLPLSEGETVRQLLGDTCNTHATKYQVDESFQTFGINDYKCSMMGQRVWAVRIPYLCVRPANEAQVLSSFSSTNLLTQIFNYSDKVLVNLRLDFGNNATIFFSVPLTKIFVASSNLKQQQQILFWLVNLSSTF